MDDDDDEGDAKGDQRKLNRDETYEEPDDEDLATLRHGQSVETGPVDSDADEAVGEEGADVAEDELRHAAPASTLSGASSPLLSLCSAEVEMKKIGVVNQHVVDFGYKAVDMNSMELWVECELPLSAPRMLYVPVFEELAKVVCVRATPGIQSAVALPPNKQWKVPTVQTAGVNFEILAFHADVIDVPAVMSNHIHAILQFYGVEAARAAIAREIDSVFAVYGISVDSRHLGLIADYMTHEGGYKALNRIGVFRRSRNELSTALTPLPNVVGMASQPSPLLKMTFETTMAFLTDAAIVADTDRLATPAASIVVGRYCLQLLVIVSIAVFAEFKLFYLCPFRPPHCGTGIFELHAHLPPLTLCGD